MHSILNAAAPIHDQHHRRDNGQDVRLTSRQRRQLKRHNSLRATIMHDCGIMPLTQHEAEQHRQRVKEQFFADLAEWVRASPTLFRFMLWNWNFPVFFMGLGFVAGIIFGRMPIWLGLASVYAFGGLLKQSIDDNARAKRVREQTARRIRTHAKWEIELGWTNNSDDMFLLLCRMEAPEELQSAVLRIRAKHPAAEFRLETFDEDPVLSVRERKPDMSTEEQVLGAWGLPEKFTFR